MHTLERLRPVVVASLLALAAALLALAPPAGAQDGDDPIVRVGGESGIDTAVALSAESFADGGATTVVIARSDDYADALTGSVLAAALNSPEPGAPPVGAPMLFTPTDSLPQVVADEIGRLGATEAVILGGVAAVSAEVEQELVDLGLTTRRVAGPNRFETALAVADEVTGGEPAETVFFVEGEHADPNRGWPDAINVAALAAQTGYPILPVNAEFVPPAIADRWEEWAEASGIIVGGTAAVTQAVEDELAALVTPQEPEPAFSQDEARDLMRLAGDTRFGTSAAVYDYAVSEAGMTNAVRVVIPGGSFVEGLAAGTRVGADNVPTIMVDGTDLDNSPASAALLDTNLDALELTSVVGGVDVISEAVFGQITESVTPEPVEAAFCLTLLHHNDGESQLIGASGAPEYGGLARMVSLANQLQGAEAPEGCDTAGTVTVTSGDNFLAGPELAASQALPDDEPIYDALGLSEMNYDALDLGNHDFDFGPDFLARFITSFTTDVPFLSANLDFGAEPALLDLVDAARIAPSTVVEKDGVQVGIIGLTTPELARISSPRNVVVDQEVQQAVQEQIDALTADGVDNIVLISHLQGVADDIALVEELSGVDAVVAGGGDEVLADPGDPLVPGDLTNVFGSYPLMATDADGDDVPVVTTAGDYKYLGRLNLYFGNDGELLADMPYDTTNSRMVRVAGEEIPGGVAADEGVVTEVIEPVQDFVDGLAEQVIGTSEVGLDGSRPNIRQTETNLGNLMADAQRWTAERLAGDFGLDETADFVGLQNGGGIRNNSVIEAGDITELTTFDVAPFPNFVGAIPDVSPDLLKQILERGYSGVENASGQFAHLSNLVVEVDLTQQAQELDDEDTIVTDGERVRSVQLADGTEIITDGEVVAGAPNVTLVTIDFLARGGDGYPLGDQDFEVLGVSYQQALSDYIQASEADGGLDGTISEDAYPEGGEGRITITGAAD